MADNVLATPPKKQREQYRPELLRILNDYAARVANDFTTGLDRSAQGLGEVIDDGNYLTGIPRLALGGLQWMGSPVSAAVSPVLGPVLQPVGEAVDTYVGQPVEQATGYPADITSELFLMGATAGAGPVLKPALRGAGKVLSSAGDAAEAGLNRAGYTLRPPEGTFFSGGGPVKLADDVAGANVGKMGNKLDDFNSKIFPDEMGIPETADTIETIAKAAGLNVKRGASGKSDSQYVTLSRADDPDGVFDEIKIRVSDHDLPSYYGELTYDVGTHGGGIQGGWVAALDEAFADLGITPPALTAQRQTMLSSGPEWARNIFRKQFDKARVRSEEFAKKKGQPED